MKSKLNSPSIKLKAFLTFSSFFSLIVISGFVIFSAIDKSKRDAEITNALGRQRMLSQAMGKTVYAYAMSKSRKQVALQQVGYLDAYITRMRKVYTEAVVEPAERFGLDIEMGRALETHPSIPFPATFTRMVNDEYKEIKKFNVEILSDFPVNAGQIIKTKMDREAIEFLKKQRGDTYSKVFEKEGKLLINVYTPDKATTERCASCHSSIKNQMFKIGDILGIRKYSLVYSDDISLGRSELNASLDNFEKYKNLFSQTLNALRMGGKIPESSDPEDYFYVQAINDGNFKNQLNLIKGKYKNFEEFLTTLITLPVDSIHFRKASQKIFSVSNDLTRESDKLVKIFVDIASYNQRKIRLAVIGSIVITLILLISLYATLNKAVLVPVIRVSNVLSLLAEGNLRQNELAVVSNDEIGKLSLSSNQLIDRLKHFIQDTENILFQRLQEHKFNLKGDFKSALSRMVDQVKEAEKTKIELEKTHQELEARVEKRTAELLNSNNTLVKEIAKREEMENSLTETNEFLKNILDSPHDISIISTDLNKNILFWNKGAENLLGYQAQEMVGVKTIDILYPENGNQINEIGEIVSKICKEKHGQCIEIEEMTKNGERIWVKMTVSPRFDNKGQIVGILGIGENISQQKLAENKLMESEEKARLIINTATVAFISIDESGIVKEWNSQAESIFGWSRQEALGKKVSKLIIPKEFLEDHEKGITRFLQTAKSDIFNKRRELIAKRKNGDEFPIEISLSAMKHKNSYIFNAFIQDISERKMLMAQLTHAQKMESIGQLAAGIAHEINTPLQFIGDNTRFLRDSLGDLLNELVEYKNNFDSQGDGHKNKMASKGIQNRMAEDDLKFLLDEIPLAIDQSLEGVERVTKIVKAMKEFSHPGTDEKKLTDINKSILTTIDVSKNTWKYGSNIETHLDPGLPLAPCYSDDLNQVILNLIVNAAHAIEEKIKDSAGEKGTITIITQEQDSWVEIIVKDTGSGIPKEIESKIFDPFFTTKSVGKGTGQGLAIVHSIVTKKHGGEIQLRSELNKGTSFVIKLPIKG